MRPSLPSAPVESGAEQQFRDKSQKQQLPRIRFLVGTTQPRLTFKNLPPPASSPMETETPERRLGGASNKADDSSTDTDDDGHLIQKAIKARDEMLKRQAKEKVLPTKRRRVNPPRIPGVSLKTLIDENFISPGDNALSLEYRGKTETASIHVDGKIEWKGMMFESPSSFSIHVKRQVNPSRKADDGWKTVKHNGRFLEFYKLELAKKRCQQNGSSQA